MWWENQRRLLAKQNTTNDHQIKMTKASSIMCQIKYTVGVYQHTFHNVSHAHVWCSLRDIRNLLFICANEWGETKIWQMCSAFISIVIITEMANKNGHSIEWQHFLLSLLNKCTHIKYVYDCAEVSACMRSCVLRSTHSCASILKCWSLLHAYML